MMNMYSREEFGGLPRAEQLRYIVSAGHLAPSSHNTQPWRFFIDGNASRIEVFLERNYVLPASDVSGRQAVISIGCGLENMRAAAAGYGMQMNATFHPRTREDVAPFKIPRNAPALVHLATLDFTNDATVTSDKQIFNGLWTRKVIRAEFDPTRTIPAETVTMLRAGLAGMPVTLHCITDAVRRLALAEFQGQADGFVINSPKFSKELGAWLLPNDTPAPLGMPGNNFGLNDTQALRLHAGLSGTAPLEPEDGLRFSLAGKLGIEKSPLICVLTTREDAPVSWLASGMALERSLLFFHGHGFATAIHAGIVEVGLVNRMFALTLGTTERMIALFRAGYLKRSEDGERPRSPRLPLDAVLLSALPQ